MSSDHFPRAASARIGTSSMTADGAVRLATRIAEHRADCYCERCADYYAALITGGFDPDALLAQIVEGKTLAEQGSNT